MNQAIMKFTSFCVVIACMCAMLNAEDLEQKHPAFGVGKHKLYEYNDNAASSEQSFQVISQLSKGGFTYIVESNWRHLKISRFPDSNENQIENIVNFNYRLRFGTGPISYFRLVDAHATNNEISFLAANQSAYYYFKVTNQNVVAPNGRFICPLKGINSPNWKLIQYHQQELVFNDGWAAWDQESVVDSIRLVNLNQIEVYKKDGAQSEVINVLETTMESNGVALPHILLQNGTTKSERFLIGLYSLEVSPTVEDLKEYLDEYEGGKDFILTLLNQFSDQNAADQIRARILEAYPPDPPE